MTNITIDFKTNKVVNRPTGFKSFISYSSFVEMLRRDDKLRKGEGVSHITVDEYGITYTIGDRS